MEEYGLLFKPRDFQKNSNRQKAALNRKRDDLGKFLDGPRELKDSVVSTINWIVEGSGPIFKITKIDRKSRQTPEIGA